MTRILASLAVVTATLAATAPATVARAQAPVLALDAASRMIKVMPGQSIQDALRAANMPGQHNAIPHPPAPHAHDDLRYVDPTIANGSLPASTLVVGKAGSFPTVKFDYTAGNAGLETVYLQFVSSNGKNSLTLQFSPSGHVVKGTADFTQPIGIAYYSKPDTYTLNYALAIDYIGQYTEYSQAQLAQIFQTTALHVVNTGPVDATPPVVSAAKIDTPTVSLSDPLPAFQVSLTATDDVSGASLAYVEVRPPGFPYSFVTPTISPLPVLSGTVPASTILAGLPAGKYTITGYALCDVANNCAEDQNADDLKALFGTTTFKVTE